MTIKSTFLVKLIAATFLVIGPMPIIEKVVLGDAFYFKDYLLLICIPFTTVIFGFVLQTVNFNFSQNGVQVYWKIGLGPFKIWEQLNYKLTWSDIESVTLETPIWSPLTIIRVYGFQGKTVRQFFIGSITTKKKETLIYISERLNAEVFDKRTLQLIEKYKREKVEFRDSTDM